MPRPFVSSSSREGLATFDLHSTEGVPLAPAPAFAFAPAPASAPAPALVSAPAPAYTLCYRRLRVSASTALPEPGLLGIGGGSRSWERVAPFYSSALSSVELFLAAVVWRTPSSESPSVAELITHERSSCLGWSLCCGLSTVHSLQSVRRCSVMTVPQPGHRPFPLKSVLGPTVVCGGHYCVVGVVRLAHHTV